MISKHCKDYIKDLFEVLLQASSLAEKIRLSIIKRPSFTISSAMNVLRRRGASPLAITKYREVLEIHQLMSLGSEASSRLDHPHMLLNQPTEETLKKVSDLQKQSIVLEDSDRGSPHGEPVKCLKELLNEANKENADEH